MQPNMRTENARETSSDRLGKLQPAMPRHAQHVTRQWISREARANMLSLLSVMSINSNIVTNWENDKILCDQKFALHIPKCSSMKKLLRVNNHKKNLLEIFREISQHIVKGEDTLKVFRSCQSKSTHGGYVENPQETVTPDRYRGDILKSF